MYKYNCNGFTVNYVAPHVTLRSAYQCPPYRAREGADTVSMEERGIKFKHLALPRASTCSPQWKLSTVLRAAEGERYIIRPQGWLVLCSQAIVGTGASLSPFGDPIHVGAGEELTDRTTTSLCQLVLIGRRVSISPFAHLVSDSFSAISIKLALRTDAASNISPRIPPSFPLSGDGNPLIFYHPLGISSVTP